MGLTNQRAKRQVYFTDTCPYIDSRIYTKKKEHSQCTCKIKYKIKLAVFERLMRLRAVYFELSTIEVIYGIVSRVGGVVSVELSKGGLHV